MTLTHYIGGKLTGLTVDFPPSLNYPELTTFINSETFTEYILVAGVWEQVAKEEFSPINVANLEAWWDVSDGTTIFKDGGNLVSQINDKSGLGNNLTQGTVTNQPLWVDAVQNGLPIMRFDGIDNFMRLAAFFSGNLSQPNTIFVVIDQEGGASNVAYDSAGNGSNRHTLFSDASNFHNMFAGAILADSTAITAPFELVTILFSGVNTTIRIDKVETVSGNGGTTPCQGFTVGANSNTSATEFAAQDIAEILIYNSDVSDEDRTSIENFLTAKWGL